MAKGRYYYNSAAPLTKDNGMPSGVMSAWMRKVSTILEGLAGFIGEEGNQPITADEIAQGITQRVREIAAKEYTYNGDGTVNTVTYKDPDTAATVATEAFTYNGDGTVATATETTTSAVVVESYIYDASQLVKNIGVSVA